MNIWLQNRLQYSREQTVQSLTKSFRRPLKVCLAKSDEPREPRCEVCDETYCELDRWQQIIAGLQAASPGFVTVLGSVAKFGLIFFLS